MAEVLCGGTIWSESEFLPNEIYWGKCGENMQAMLQSWARQKYRSTQDVYTAMRKAKRCDLSGASTMAQQIAQAKADGFRIDSLGTNTGMSEAMWRNFLMSHLPNEAVGIEVANGSALKDELTGLGEDATNLKFHYITIFGHHDGGKSPHAGKTLPAGWWVADGDSYVNNTKTSSGWNRHLSGHILCFYSEQTLRNARPCAALAMYPKAMIPGGSSVALPSGWKDDGAQLTNPANGYVVVQAKRQYILDNDWQAEDVPQENVENNAEVQEFAPLGGGNSQTFTYSRLIWANKDGKVVRQPLGAEYLKVRRDRDALRAQVSALQAQLAQGGGSATDPRAQQLLEAVQNAVK